jgi:hypothetical protein
MSQGPGFKGTERMSRDQSGFDDDKKGVIFING